MEIIIADTLAVVVLLVGLILGKSK